MVLLCSLTKKCCVYYMGMEGVQPGKPEALWLVGLREVVLFFHIKGY